MIRDPIRSLVNLCANIGRDDGEWECLSGARTTSARTGARGSRPASGRSPACGPRSTFSDPHIRDRDPASAIVGTKGMPDDGDVLQRNNT